MFFDHDFDSFASEARAVFNEASDLVPRDEPFSEDLFFEAVAECDLEFDLDA
jgi:hypothetical protein